MCLPRRPGPRCGGGHHDAHNGVQLQHVRQQGLCVFALALPGLLIFPVPVDERPLMWLHFLQYSSTKHAVRWHYLDCASSIVHQGLSFRSVIGDVPALRLYPRLTFTSSPAACVGCDCCRCRHAAAIWAPGGPSSDGSSIFAATGNTAGEWLSCISCVLHGVLPVDQDATLPSGVVRHSAPVSGSALD